MSLSSSNLDLPSDWAVVSSPSESLEQEIGLESSTEVPSNSNDDMNVDSESTPNVGGSAVQDIAEETDSPNLNDSTSSSDIDIIDENALDDSPVKKEFVPPAFSISSSSESSSSSQTQQTPATETADAANQNEDNQNNWQSWVTFLMNCFDRAMGLIEIFRGNDMFRERNSLRTVMAILVLCLTVNVMKIQKDSKTADVADELQKLITELQLENKNLKNQVMLEMQNDKIFLALEEQMKELKNENVKLQEFILSLQKQSSTENKNKKETHNFYKKEINYLKEQINLLQFDNEELQKQLVRMRYGSYLSKTETGKEDMENEENSSEILSNEVKELRKDLQNEISKLKKLNELIEFLTKELQKSESKEKFSFGTKTDEKMHTDRKGSHWGWKNVKKNIEDYVQNIQQINISDLFSKYVSNSKIPLEDAFKNIGYFFKATQKEINSQKEYLKERWDNDFKATLEELGEKWSELKTQYFKMNDNTENAEENENSKPEFSNVFTDSYRNPEEIKPKTHHYQANDEMSRKRHFAEKYLQEKHRQDGKINEDDLQSKSWVFERAAERAKLRESDEEDESVNWFLRRKSTDEKEDEQKSRWF
ncbi:uncharacterized protein LOC129216990 [Uloborus diversus]|uniref:uncharacterized protein LOC129216990 n=1 Tax=Uloborus diversus TaxID=327109 RepID=UPI0024099342|nr:uncharacterized protein LOC129216990 [Uloborus diversus]XP_054707189.1 uncharacterized protein LOC129216990 [Uloborus diversus]